MCSFFTQTVKWKYTKPKDANYVSFDAVAGAALFRKKPGNETDIRKLTEVSENVPYSICPYLKNYDQTEQNFATRVVAETGDVL